MNIYKEFMQHIRKISYKDAYIILGEDILPQLTEYTSLIENVKFEDGAYHDYFGTVKKYIESFMNYWKLAIDDVIQEVDRCTNVIDKEELLELLEQTMNIHQARQIAYGKVFLPVHSTTEKETYEEMEELYKQNIEKLHEMKEKLEKLYKQEQIYDFVKEHFKITIMRTAELFEESHLFLALMLADRINQILISMEEMLHRLRSNLSSIQDELEKTQIDLLHQLYEKNKDMLRLSRQDRKCSIEHAETTHGIERIRAKIEKNTFDPPISRLEEEVAYWEKQVDMFQECTHNLIALKKEQENVVKQEQIYNNLKTTDLPGNKRECWLNMGENFAERKQYLKEKIKEAARPLMTFFSIKGTDRIYYCDDLGSYYVDEFRHQVYVFNYGLDVYHRNCQGDFVPVPDKSCYYFDTFGRYVINKDGSKVYQCAQCTSEYKLTHSNLLKKTTKDCGHSERMNKHCKVQIRDASKIEVLPTVEQTDIKKTLDPEVVQYLWRCFGHILPYALYDVAREPTKNPIHNLAHKILLHKYNKTKIQLDNEVKEAEGYRANIFSGRKEKAVAASKAWKAKQTKRRKPEESDDRDERVVHDLFAAQQAMADAMNCHYD